MKIWVDADACPKAVKEILFRVAHKRRIAVTLVANSHMHIPDSEFVALHRVSQGFDRADREIVEMMEAGDLVVTADIPLAAEVVDKGGVGLNPRGELYTTENVKACLTMRNFMAELRGSGVETGGPEPFKPNDRHAFANQLDRYLTQHARQE